MNERITLLDVNVLVALLWPGHMHHSLARSWFLESRAFGWATCPITEMGCVRVLARDAVTSGRLSVGGAAEALVELTAGLHHQFWPDHLSLTDPVFNFRHMQGPRQLTDRYLLALAAAHDGTFATFDGAVGAGLPPDSPLLPHLEVIAA